MVMPFFLGPAAQSAASPLRPLNAWGRQSRSCTIPGLRSGIYAPLIAHSSCCSLLQITTAYAGLWFCFWCRLTATAHFSQLPSMWAQSPLCGRVFLFLQQKRRHLMIPCSSSPNLSHLHWVAVRAARAGPDKWPHAAPVGWRAVFSFFAGEGSYPYTSYILTMRWSFS